METIDSYVADELKKLEDKYPVVGKQPSEVSFIMQFFALHFTKLKTS